MYFQGEKGSEGPIGPQGLQGLSIKGEKVLYIKYIIEKNASKILLSFLSMYVTV
jgi:hypothetical protein